MHKKYLFLEKKWAAEELVSRFENRAEKHDFWGWILSIYNKVVPYAFYLLGVILDYVGIWGHLTGGEDSLIINITKNTKHKAKKYHE